MEAEITTVWKSAIKALYSCFGLLYILAYLTEISVWLTWPDDITFLFYMSLNITFWQNYISLDITFCQNCISLDITFCQNYISLDITFCQNYISLNITFCQNYISLDITFCQNYISLDITFCQGERGGSVVECRTPELEVGGSKLTAAVWCPWARHFTPRKYWLITQEAVAPSRYDWKIVDWDVKPQHKQNFLPKVHQFGFIFCQFYLSLTSFFAKITSVWHHFKQNLIKSELIER